jgi:hypothetical protein
LTERIGGSAGDPCRPRLLDEPAQLVASAAEQAERSADVIAHMLNPPDPPTAW